MAVIDHLRVGCLRVPRFAVSCELAERPELRGHPVVVGEPGRPAVLDVSEEAEKAGVRPGQLLRQAIALCPRLEVLEARPTHLRQIVDAMLSSLEQVAPGIEPVEDGTALIDLRGLSGCYQDEQELGAAMLACVPGVLGPGLGLAADRFTARVAATITDPGTMRIVEAAQARDFLEPHPVSILPVSREMHRRLRLLGIRQLGQLAALPRAATTAQFGPEGLAAWRMARGADSADVHPRPWRQMAVQRLPLAAPLSLREPLLAALQQLINQLCAAPAFRNAAARQATLTMLTERDGEWRRTLTFKEPMGEARTLFELLRPLLADAQLPGPAIEIELELGDLVPARGWQALLPVSRGGRTELLERGLRQLRSRYGYCPVFRVVGVEPWSRIPERRTALIDCIS
jgi:protein ImuB